MLLVHDYGIENIGVLYGKLSCIGIDGIGSCNRGHDARQQDTEAIQTGRWTRPTGAEYDIGDDR